jgi:xanthine permease XanP
MAIIKKPANIIYGVEESPPLIVTIFNGIQHVGVVAINLVCPLLIFRTAGATPEFITSLLGAGMIILGLATFLQASRLGPVGSGYMCPATFTATYLAPSLLAAKFGGLPLVFGMTIVGGLFETALAPLLNRLRTIFPREVSGLVIFMIGLSGGIAGELKFPDQRPTNAQIRETEDGTRLLAGFLLRRNADRVHSEWNDGKANMLFHFDH